MSGQKSTACLEDISVWDFYYSVPALYLQWSIIFIFCLLAPEGMNSIVFGRDKGGMVGSLLLAWKISMSGIFIVLFPHYICNGLLFLFSACWLQKE